MTNGVPTVYADFNNRIGNRLRLSCDGTKRDLANLGLTLQDGMTLRVSDGELAATGQVKWMSEWRDWFIEIDLNDIEDLQG